jgi:hypothetical protein
MKSLKIFPALLLGITVLFSSCLKDECDAVYHFQELRPIYVQPAQFRNAEIRTVSSQALKNPGKIYVFGKYLFINEIREGVHVIDNSDPENPNFVHFIHIPGNMDIEVNGQYLYADSYSDLLAIDIRDITNPRITNRYEDIFTPFVTDPVRGYLMYYEALDRQMAIPCDDPRASRASFEVDDVIFARPEVFRGGVLTAQSQDASGAASGFRGSFARFAQIPGYLYVIDNFNMDVFGTKNPSSPDIQNTVHIGWNIETLFPTENRLFIGSREGMYIYDNTDPVRPVQMSYFAHARACDPVFVYGETAFVTLRDGNECENFSNQLDVIDISDEYNPLLIETYPMTHPHGLSVKEDVLYLCDGRDGLKIFDVSKLNAIDENRLAHLEGMHTYDVIALPSDLLLVIGSDGFYQYDISSPGDARFLSHIPVIEN